MSSSFSFLPFLLLSRVLLPPRPPSRLLTLDFCFFDFNSGGRGSLRRTRSRLVPSGRRLRSLLPPSLRPSPPTPTSDVPRGYDRLSSSPFGSLNPFDLIRTAYALKLKFRQGTTCPRYGRRDSSTSSDGRGWTASSVVQAAISPPNNGQDTPKQTLPSSGQGRSTVGILLA